MPQDIPRAEKIFRGYGFLSSEERPEFSLEKYFPAIIEECRSLGREVSITKKDKKNFGKVESAFLKDNTDVYNISFQTEQSLKIKIEVDTQPPLGFQMEQLPSSPFQRMCVLTFC